MTMLIKLENHYRGCGILSTAFSCKHESACRGGLELTSESATTLDETRGTFTPAKSAYVGEHYGDGVPRLLFVSLDPGTALSSKDRAYTYTANESRTPEGVQAGETARARRIDKYEALPSNRLRWTNRMAGRIFCMRDKADVMRFYAHVNAVKCTMNKKYNRKADGILFENCREYLRDEIDILSPDVIVTLGEEAKGGVEYAFSVESEWGREEIVRLSDGRESLWLPIYHPSNFGAFHKQRKSEQWGPDWKKFAERVREFMSARAV